MKKFIYSIIEHRLFQIGLFIKGIYGVLEAIFGVVLLFINSRQATIFVQGIFGQELLEDPKDFFGNLFMRLAQDLYLRYHVFISLYLVVHGLVNIGLVLALNIKKLWVFPSVAAILSLFVLYEIYQIMHHFSFTLLILILADIMILVLLKFEYDRLKEMKHKQHSK